ncbi:MAG: hypothetical protein U9R25_16355 [Chloroflexota bacterium]|nr:hypothetical protein [Chloroflexota bacterium]
MTNHGSVQSPKPNLIDRLYRLFVSDQLLALVLGLLALTLLAILLLPQLPRGTSKADATARWMADTSARFGSIGPMFRDSGLFDLRQSPWLWILAALLAFILLLRFGQAMSEAIERFGGQDPTATASEAREWSLQAGFMPAGDLDTTVAELEEDLQNEGWQVRSVLATDVADLGAERNRWGLFASPLIYLGLFAILASLWLNQVLGWQEPNLVLVPGQWTRLVSRSDLQVSLEMPDQNGPAVLVREKDAAPASQPITDRGVAHVAGLTIKRAGEGQALTVAAQTAEGSPLQLQPLEQQSTYQSSLRLVFEQPRAERVFLVPARQLAFSIVAFPALPERGFAGPTFLVQAFEVGQPEPIYNQFVDSNTQITIGDDVYHLRTGRFMTVGVSSDPGFPLMAGSCLLVLAGLLLSLWRPAGRLHMHIQTQRAGSQRVDAGLDPSRSWRQAARWFAAWAATYGGGLTS